MLAGRCRRSAGPSSSFTGPARPARGISAAIRWPPSPPTSGARSTCSLPTRATAKGFSSSVPAPFTAGPNRPTNGSGEQDYGVIDPLDVNLCYAESKRLGETLCACWRHQFGVPAKIVRIGHAYGPGMRLDDGRVSRDFVADVLHAGRCG